jgi:hypothetical protein
MRGLRRRTIGLLALCAALVGACQLVSGLTGYSETGGTAGSGGATTSSSTSTSSSTGATGGSTSSSSIGASSSSTSSSTTSSSTGGASDAGPGTVVTAAGNIDVLRAVNGVVGWTIAGDTVTLPSVGFFAGGVLASSAQEGLVSGALALDDHVISYLVAEGGSCALGSIVVDASVPKTTVLALTTASSRQALATDGNGFVLWGQLDTISLGWLIEQTQPGMGAQITQETSAAQAPVGIAADSGDVYWTEGTSIRYQSRNGVPGTSDFASGSSVIFELAIDPTYSNTGAGNLFWLQAAIPGQVDVCAAPKTLGILHSCATPLAAGRRYAHSLSIAVDPLSQLATTVYWAESSAPDDCTVDGFVLSRAVGAPLGTPNEQLAVARCPRVAADSVGGYVYWSSGPTINRSKLP